MQWILTLLGLALGWVVDESFADALIGALVGLGIAQAFRLGRLGSQAAKQQILLQEAQQSLLTLEARLTVLERGKVAESSDSAPAPEVVVPQAAKPETRTEPELVWELPPDLEPVPAMATQASQPLPDDVWKPAPTTSSRRAERDFAPLPLEPMPLEPRVSKPAAPRGPNLFDRAVIGARNWLFGGNTVLRVGVVLLFLGLAFLLRYATEGMVVPIELRYAGVAASALGLLGLGWWLRQRNSNYALMLQGTGIAVLYLTVFAAMRLHPLLDSKAALGLLVAVTVFSAILAITQNALGLAAAAALGGFAAPILTSTGSGNHVALFSYFILLNAGILAIAWFKAWRLLNLIGFVGTFGIGFAWGMRSYTPELLWSTEPFLILFFLIYLAIGLLFTRRKLLEMSDAPEDASRDALLHWSARKGDYVDGTMLFGPPLVGFGLQFALVQHFEFAAAFSALALGMIYMGLARVLMGGRALLLAETCLALGVIFASLAIPLGLDARWTAAAWAVEGAGIFWLGLRQQRPFARAFALLLQLGSALAFVSELRIGDGSLLDGSALGALMLGGALLFTFYQLHKAEPEHSANWERRGLPVLAVLGLSFLYLLAPLFFFTHGTAIAWALAGLATLFVGLRLQSRSFLFSAFGVQLLGGALFLLRLQGAEGDSAVVFSAGWSGLLSASLIGLALIGGMLLAARDDMVRNDVRLLRGLSVVLLAGLVLINLAVLFVLPWQTASGVWAASGLLIIWLSLYLKQRVSFVFGLLLQLLGGAAFLTGAGAVGAAQRRGSATAGPQRLLDAAGAGARSPGGRMAPATGARGAGTRGLELAASVRAAADLGRRLVGAGVGQRSIALCPGKPAGQLAAAGCGDQRGGVDSLGAALEMAGAGAAVYLVDSGGGLRAGGNGAQPLSPGREFRLAGLAGGICRAFPFSQAPGADAAGPGEQYGPCARLLAADGGVDAGVALRPAVAVRAVQRLALAGLGDPARPLPGADGHAACLAVAGIGPTARVPCLRGGADGVVDARLVLADQHLQRWQLRAAALCAVAQSLGAGPAVRLVRYLCVGPQCRGAIDEPLESRRAHRSVDRRCVAVRVLHRPGDAQCPPVDGGAIRAGRAARVDVRAGRVVHCLDPDRPGADDRWAFAPPS